MVKRNGSLGSNGPRGHTFLVMNSDNSILV
jgi:hypothetical protein